MKLSIGGYSFYNTLVDGKIDIFGYLETVRYRYNLNTVDLYNGFFTDKTTRIWQIADDDYLRKIREALDERELTVANIAIDRASLWDEDEDVREQMYQNALKHLRACELLGVKTIRIDTGGPFANNPNGNFNELSEEQFEHIVKRYQEYANIAAQFGAIVGPENHMGPSLNPHFMKKIADAVNHPNYGVLLHVDRWKVDPEIGDSMVAPYAYHVHFGGNTLSKEEYSTSIATLIQDTGYDGYWAVEHNGPGNQYIEVEWVLATMKKVLKNIQV